MPIRMGPKLTVIAQPASDDLGASSGNRTDAESAKVSLMIRRRVLISGRVQGVAFRDTCQRVATERGVAGWVRNLGDGRVEAVFEGTAEQVDRMVEWMHGGPRLADVA